MPKSLENNSGEFKSFFNHYEFDILQLILTAYSMGAFLAQPKTVMVMTNSGYSENGSDTTKQSQGNEICFLFSMTSY